jgi:putative Mg2+ transporter-C (MgtC) family protein
VHGLTTAACLWIVSAIGLAVGSGLHFAAILSFAITLVSLWLLRYVEERIPRLAYKYVTIVVDRDAPEEQLRAAVTDHGPRITEIEYELDAEGGRMTYRITIASEHLISERTIVDALGRLPAVRHIKVHA